MEHFFNAHHESMMSCERTVHAQPCGHADMDIEWYNWHHLSCHIVEVARGENGCSPRRMLKKSIRLLAQTLNICSCHRKWHIFSRAWSHKRSMIAAQQSGLRSLLWLQRKQTIRRESGHYISQQRSIKSLTFQIWPFYMAKKNTQFWKLQGLVKT